ncbi:cyclic nucleotide-binding domain-containing protein [Skermanella stibiiresistens]|nr:cyclic nucleotide-binding domain-containing protein [Skermanella stibiiresistens]
MAATFQHKQYEPGDLIFQKGDSGEFLYLVERGSVIIWTGTEDDKRVLGEVGTGGLFGEMAILNRQPRMANASASAETRLLEMPASVLRQTINRADPLLVQLINVLIENLRRSAKDTDPQV